MSGTPMPFVAPQWFTNAGAPAVGLHLHTFLSGTTTDVATYTTQALTVANANPVVLNAAGRASIFLTPGVSYKFELSLSTDTHPPASPIWSVDGVSAVPPGSSSADTDVPGTAGETIAAGNCCYVSDGSGGTTAGRWYLVDADAVGSSTAAQKIGFATAAISTGASGTLRTEGRVTGLTGLVAGTWYYASATAGALTSSAPTNARIVAQADTTTSVLVVNSIPTASATVSGLITTGTQTIAGAKTGTGAWTFSSTVAFDGVATYSVIPVGLGMPRLNRCTSALTKNANTTFADITGLAFPVVANATYAFVFVMQGVSSAAADFKFTLTGPAAPTAVQYGVPTANLAIAASSVTAFGSTIVCTAGSFEDTIILTGLLRNGANAGTVQAQMAQNTSDASNSVIRVESFVIDWRMA